MFSKASDGEWKNVGKKGQRTPSPPPKRMSHANNNHKRITIRKRTATTTAAMTEENSMNKGVPTRIGRLRK